MPYAYASGPSNNPYLIGQGCFLRDSYPPFNQRVLLGISWDFEWGSGKIAGMRDTELYERLLGLKEPWKVKAVKMDVEGRRVEVEVECAERTIWASPESRQRLHIHGWERRSWRHLDTCGFATVIMAEVPRVKDEKGQTETVAVPWAEKFSRFTRSFEAFGVEVLRAARSLSDACELLSISWDQAHRIMERAVARGLERRCLEELRCRGHR